MFKYKLTHIYVYEVDTRGVFLLRKYVNLYSTKRNSISIKCFKCLTIIKIYQLIDQYIGN